LLAIRSLSAKNPCVCSVWISVYRGVFDFRGTFNFSANRLLLLSRTEYRTCVAFLMQDPLPRAYRLYDLTKSHEITPGQYCVSGKVHSADKLYLVIESVKRDTKHNRCSYHSCSC